MTNNNFIIKESSLLKKVVANVAILPNSSILTFTSGENVHKLWPGIQLWLLMITLLYLLICLLTHRWCTVWWISSRCCSPQPYSNGDHILHSDNSWAGVYTGMLGLQHTVQKLEVRINRQYYIWYRYNNCFVQS